MKRIICLLLCLFLCIPLSACTGQPQENTRREEKRPTVNYPTNLKGIWLSYYEIGDIFLKLDRDEAEQKASEMFFDLAQKGINTVFFHVRAFSDATYRSAYFPCSKYCNEEYDLLRLVIQAAHEHNLSFHAWINPYRVALNAELTDLDDASPAVELYKKNKENLLFFDGGIYMNPARKGVQKLILNGIREIVENYEVDGIQFDDYFYPTDEKGIDAKSYAGYKNAGGTASLQDFRRENVTALVCAAHTLIQSVNPNIVFGISPQASIEANREKLFADISKWIELGAVDYLLPQIYFGFENETSPFAQVLSKWCDLMQGKKVKLYCGLALYKSGKEDEYASKDKENKDSAYYEWCNHTDIIEREIELLKQNEVAGYALYSYQSLVNAQEDSRLQEEIDSILPLLKE